MEVAPFSFAASAGSRRPIVRLDPADGTPELIDLAWGLEPYTPDQKPFRFIRSEGRTFPSHRCLIPASEFDMKTPRGKCRARLRSGDWFYLAGIWRPKTPTWPEAFAIITVEANADVAPFQERQGAIILRGTHAAWLQPEHAEERFFRPLPHGTFSVERVASPVRRQQRLSF